MDRDRAATGSVRSGTALSPHSSSLREIAADPTVVALLSDPASFPGHLTNVEMIETHMSLVFLAGDHVYKMKKAVHLGFVDFTEPESRRQNCEREIAINRQLAPGVYEDLLAVVRGPSGQLQLGGRGDPIEWVVLMKRLDQSRLLHQLISRSEVDPAAIDRLAGVLTEFYASAPAIPLTAAELPGWWHGMVERTSRSLLDPLFALPRDQVEKVTTQLATFLESRTELIAERANGRRIIDGHGDLRPEHVYLGDEILLIDRLEFDPKLRWIDPFDEVLFLGMECDRLGAPWIGAQLVTALEERLEDRPPPALLRFYRCFRAALRAGLSIEHMRDSTPRAPERWPRQARDYLALALGSLPDLHS